MIALLIANSLALASLLIMLSSGLALIYGLRDVINFGHGAIYMLGAYVGYTVALVGGFWLALLVVPILLALLGIAFEYLALRPLQRRSHIEVALVTLGLGIILGQVIIYLYGGEARSVDAPQILSGSVTVLNLSYPVYRLFLIVMGLGSCVLLALSGVPLGITRRPLPRDREYTQICHGGGPSDSQLCCDESQSVPRGPVFPLPPRAVPATAAMEIQRNADFSTVTN